MGAYLGGGDTCFSGCGAWAKALVRRGVLCARTREVNGAEIYGASRSSGCESGLGA